MYLHLCPYAGVCVFQQGSVLSANWPIFHRLMEGMKGSVVLRSFNLSSHQSERESCSNAPYSVFKHLYPSIPTSAPSQLCWCLHNCLLMSKQAPFKVFEWFFTSWHRKAKHFSCVAGLRFIFNAMRRVCESVCQCVGGKLQPRVRFWTLKEHESVFYIPLQCQFPFGFASFLISILAVTCKSANIESLSAILFKFLSCSVKVDERSGSKICPQEKWPMWRSYNRQAAWCVIFTRKVLPRTWIRLT